MKLNKTIGIAALSTLACIGLISCKHENKDATNASASTEASATASALGTEDQKAVENLAIELLKSPEVEAQIKTTKEELSKIPQSEVSKATLEQAVNELAFAAALGAANNDPTHPKITWAYTAPREWFGRATPGSRWGIDNPDNAYRFATIDAGSKYELKVLSVGEQPAQFSYLVYDTYIGENTKQKNLDSPIDGLKDTQLKPEADGSYIITIDSTEGKDVKNHIRTNADAKILLIRNTLNDWDKQKPQVVSIKRIGGPEAKDQAPDAKALAQVAAEYLKEGTKTLARFKTTGPWVTATPNTLTKPFARGGGWGFASSGSFKISEDEALLVTVNPLGAQYVGFDLTTPWLVSHEHIKSTGSLNNNQAEKNEDGTYTYVIAAKDPGVKNWINSEGQTEGSILVRLQSLPDSVKTADNGIQSVKKVKLADISKELPKASLVKPEERTKANEERAASYAKRYQ